MNSPRHHRLILLAGIATIMPQGLLAQTAPDPAVAPAPQAKTVANKRVFVPADFARFAPKTAFDMLAQVPGFTIRGSDQERGLGQASENVLINGQRIANKSGGAIDELQKISATNVERVEIVEAASLGIAGLSGEVANVFVKANNKASGQFEWKPQGRAHYAKLDFTHGSISYSGQKGPVAYTLSVKNDGGHGGFGGPIRIVDGNGLNTENRQQIVHSEDELVTFQTKLAIDAPGSSRANLTLAYTPYWGRSYNSERRTRLDRDDRDRLTLDAVTGYYIDVSGDYDVAVGPGRFKLIGLRHFDHEPGVTTQTTRFDSGAATQGTRFTRDSRKGETVGRAEYGFKTGKNDWQVTFERAFNSLDQRGALAILSPGGVFADVPFPEGSGKVSETRYEAIGTWSRALSPALDLQVAAGAEVSSLDRVDDPAPPRKFFRPKGSLTLGWRPAPGWDASFKLRRRVGQISFYDFLAQPNLSNDRENAGNPDLVPPQSWEVEGEVGRSLGRWGKTRLRLYAQRIDDIVDIIPIGEDGEGVGNLPRATRYGLESTSTLLFDPIGWRGAKLDVSVQLEKSSVRDPLTGIARPITGNLKRSFNVSLRDDIPGSKIAWGAEIEHSKRADNFFLSEIGRSYEGPLFTSFYVEHKDLFGLTVRASLINPFNGRHYFNRVVYAGRRDRSPVLFEQRSDQLIGPIFRLSVKGNF